MDREKIARLGRRLSGIKEKMKELSLDAILFSCGENKSYLSAFESTSYEIFITREANYLLTDFRYIEAAQELTSIYEIVQTDAQNTLYKFLQKVYKAGGIRSIGLEYEHISLKEYMELKKTLPECSFEPAGGIAEKLRIVKDPWELENIRRAAEIADEAFSYILMQIRPGVSEKEIAWLLERKMRESGASGLSFETICASGVRSSMPHARPTDELIKNGDFVTMDYGCVYNGYCSDMTRTVAVGSVSDKQREVYDIVLRAQKAACDSIRAGITGKQADAFARDIIADAGYAKYFGHSLGHGVGLEIHEAPTASPRSDEVFGKNMLITSEPGIYLPGEFGVRIEDLCIVEDSAIINLTKSPKELIIV